MKLCLDKHIGPVVAMLAGQIAALVVLFLVVSWQAIGYLFPWAILIVVHLSFSLHLPEMTLPILCAIEAVAYAVVVGLAFGGNRFCRWLLILLLLLHVVGIALCKPWTTSRTF